MKRLSLVVAVIISMAFLPIFLSGCGVQNAPKTETPTATYADGSKYVGGFKGGLFDGQGTLTYPDARKYVGQFKDGKMDGTGKMIYPDGKVEEGVWKDGKFLGA